MTTTRNTESLQVVSIAVGDALTVTAPPGSTCYVAEPITFSVASTVTGATQVFGPFATPTVLNLSASNGAVNWSVGRYSSSTPAPSLFTSRVLVAADNGAVLVCTASPSATVNAGMSIGFGVGFKGTVTVVAGANVTVNDVRTSGATNPWCSLTQIGTDTYDIVGSKV
jgi:hypothetical protein